MNVTHAMLPTPTSPFAGARTACTDILDEVFFINPNAAQARAKRAKKLAAARARLAAQAAHPRPGAAGAAASGSSDEKEERKQQRMLRNRESAALSRKRKSDRIGELEVQVGSLEDENRRLRRRIQALESVGTDNNRAGTPAVAGTTPAPRPPYAWYPRPAQASARCSCRASASSSFDSMISSASDSNTVAPALAAVAGSSAYSAMPMSSCFNISRPAVFA